MAKGNRNQQRQQAPTTQNQETTVSDQNTMEGNNDEVVDTTATDTANAGQPEGADTGENANTGADTPAEGGESTGGESDQSAEQGAAEQAVKDVTATTIEQVAAAVAPSEPAPAKVEAVPAVETSNEFANLDPLSVASLQQIDSYLENMRPGRPVDAAAINRNQISLHRALLNIINNVERDFDKTWALVLQRFVTHAAKGAFRETHLFRGLDNLTLGPDSRQCFQRLLNLCLVTAEPQGRHLAVKQIDFKRTLEFDVTDAGRTKLQNFYRV